jgi:hypothetical protein
MSFEFLFILFAEKANDPIEKDSNIDMYTPYVSRLGILRPVKENEDTNSQKYHHEVIINIVIGNLFAAIIPIAKFIIKITRKNKDIYKLNIYFKIFLIL